jgi:multidrug efflux pump subunit AcrA (membrane-fusion protein)
MSTESQDLLVQAADLLAQADTLAAQALFGDLFASQEAHIKALRDQARALQIQADELVSASLSLEAMAEALYAQSADYSKEARTLEEAPAPELVNPLYDVSVVIRADDKEESTRPHHEACISDLIATWVLVCERYQGARLFLRGLSDGEEVEVELTETLNPSVVNYEERKLLMPLFDAINPTSEQVHEIATQQIARCEERLNHFKCRVNPPMRRHYEGALDEWRAILSVSKNLY